MGEGGSLVDFFLGIGRNNALPPVSLLPKVKRKRRRKKRQREKRKIKIKSSGGRSIVKIYTNHKLVGICIKIFYGRYQCRWHGM